MESLCNDSGFSVRRINRRGQRRTQKGKKMRGERFCKKCSTHAIMTQAALDTVGTGALMAPRQGPDSSEKLLYGWR